MIARSGRILPDGLPCGLPIMNGIHIAMGWHKIRAKKNRHIRRLFSFGGGLNGRYCNAKDQGNHDTNRNQRGLPACLIYRTRPGMSTAHDLERNIVVLIVIKRWRRISLIRW